MSYMKRLASMAIVAGPFCFFAASTHATPIIETPGNALVQQVDPLGKIEPPLPPSPASLASGSIFNIATPLPGSPVASFDPGALTLTCTATKCASFDWAFNQGLTTLGDDWNIVRLGIRYGTAITPVNFLIDLAGIGADSGSFSVLDYNPGINGSLLKSNGSLNANGTIPVAFQFNTPDFYLFTNIIDEDNEACSGSPALNSPCVLGIKYSLRNLNEVEFFGSFTTANISVTEPETLALFGIGLLGLGIAARRRKAVL